MSLDPDDNRIDISLNMKQIIKIALRGDLLAERYDPHLIGYQLTCDRTAAPGMWRKTWHTDIKHLPKSEKESLNHTLFFCLRLLLSRDLLEHLNTIFPLLPALPEPNYSCNTEVTDWTYDFQKNIQTCTAPTINIRMNKNRQGRQEDVSLKEKIMKDSRKVRRNGLAFERNWRKRSKRN